MSGVSPALEGTGANWSKYMKKDQTDERSQPGPWNEQGLVKMHTKGTA